MTLTFQIFRDKKRLPKYLTDNIRTNSLKANAGKFQFMILNRKNHRRQRMVIISITVKESNEVILLDITIDNKLVFKKHMRIYVEQLNISSML